MTRETEIATLLRADAELTSILVGGIYTDEEVGVEGIRRGDDSPTAQAFDASGTLLPCAVVRQSDLVPVDSVRMQRDRMSGTSQLLQIYFYQFRQYNHIELARQRCYELLEGVRLAASYPLIWVVDSPYFYDVGPVANAITLYQNWRIFGLRRAA